MKRKNTIIQQNSLNIKDRSSEISRRDALRYISEGILGMTFWGTLFSSCSGSSPHQRKDLNMDEFSFRLIPCCGCGECMPCPYGVDIVKNLLFMNELRGYGEIPDPRHRGREGFSKKRKRFLAEYNNRIPRLAQADHCIGCGKCLSRCKQKVDIEMELRHIDMLITNLKKE